MTSQPLIDEFRRQIEALRKHSALAPHISRTGEVQLGKLTIDSVADLIRQEAGYYLLLAAAGLNRTTLKRATNDPEAQVAPKEQRKAYAIRARLPVRVPFGEISDRAVTLRAADLGRSARGGVEKIFRDRLAAEGIPIAMSPPVRQVPSLLVAQRKPDGVYPDPATKRAPLIYLEVKNLRRVSDDIQKRLYEIAEASLEMKLLYGALDLRGLDLKSTQPVIDAAPELRQRIRNQIEHAMPVVVALLLCPRAAADRYRAGAEAFVDRVFFQEEIDDCLEFLKSTLRRVEPGWRPTKAR